MPIIFAKIYPLSKNLGKTKFVIGVKIIPIKKIIAHH
jgi:hypothetical protein